MEEVYKKLTDYLPLLKTDEFGEWIIDTKNDGTPAHPMQMPYVSYSDIIGQFIRDIHGFMNEHEEYEPNRYGEILEKHEIEWEMESMVNADVSRMDGQGVMALLMGAVRAERFCDGALLGYLKRGAITKWLERLCELDQKE
ncbi:MAG TPA: DUF6508 domain-containing protein [Lachnospiraceae bacterium]|nr:DUF6508 domain-containing protein [Lachnospiraceae bacterium]